MVYFVLYRYQVESGSQLGGAFSVYYRGEKVVNLVGGYADPEAEVPWRENTLSQFFSTTKGVSALVIAMLESRYIEISNLNCITYIDNFV